MTAKLEMRADGEMRLTIGDPDYPERDVLFDFDTKDAASHAAFFHAIADGMLRMSGAAPIEDVTSGSLWKTDGETK